MDSVFATGCSVLNSAWAAHRRRHQGRPRGPPPEGPFGDISSTGHSFAHDCKHEPSAGDSTLHKRRGGEYDGSQLGKDPPIISYQKK